MHPFHSTCGRQPGNELITEGYHPQDTNYIYPGLHLVAHVAAYHSKGAVHDTALSIHMWETARELVYHSRLPSPRQQLSRVLHLVAMWLPITLRVLFT